MGWLTFLYLASFIIGLTFTVSAFLMSCLERFSRVLSQPAERKFNSWLNFNASAVLLTWFGAAGFIFRSLKISEELTLALAILAGLAGYATIWLYASRQNLQKRAGDTSLKGTVARVRQVGTDAVEIVFYSRGVHFAVPARAADGRSLVPGAQVVVLSQEKGVALVEDLDRFLVRTGAGRWTSTQLKSPRS
jgi:hypothetical protein